MDPRPSFRARSFVRSSEVCPSPPLRDDLRRQEWLSTRVVAFLVSGLFWLPVAGFLFRLPCSSIRLEGRCVYLSQARSRGFRRRSVHWVPVSQCIDDRHVGQLFTAPLRMTRGPSSRGALAAAYIMCYLLIEEVILLVLTSRSPLLRLACVFSVSRVTRCVKRFPSPKKKKKKERSVRH